MGKGAEAEGTGTLARIRDHLKQKGVDALVEMIVDLAERDPALFGKLDMAAAASHDDEKTLEKRLSTMIDSAIKTVYYIRYREAPAWAAGVNEALDAVADLVPNGRAALALKLVTRAIEGIEQTIESIDDSDGHCGALLHRASDIHYAAVREVRPEPVQLARDLFAREIESEYETFAGSVKLYAEVLGEAGLAEYRRFAAEAWEKLPTRMGKIKGRDDLSYGNFYPLRKILDFFAEREGDVEARIALRSKDLTSPWSYLELAEFCLAQGRAKEALRWAEEGVWLFEDDRQDQRLVLLVAKLLSEAGRKTDAEVHLWRAFEKVPSLEMYEQLRKLGGKTAGDRAVKVLEAKSVSGQRIRWHSASDLLIQILIREKMFDEAWAAAREHQASMELRLALARASEAGHPREALAVYVERVDQLANGGGNIAYEEAAKLVRHMGGLRSATEQASYVAALKTRFKLKRNFMKLLG